MNKYSTTNEINNLICDANDCTNKAYEKIIIKAGKYGHIILFLCKDCIPKFKES
jgi:hypothetical protein